MELMVGITIWAFALEAAVFRVLQCRSRERVIALLLVAACIIPIIIVAATEY